MNKIQSSIIKYVDPLMIIQAVIIASLLVSNVMSYKETHFFNIDISLGTLSVPIMLALLNPIAEVMGYVYTRRLILAAILAELIFAVSIHYLSYLSSANKTIDSAYILVTQHVVRGSLSFSIGDSLGSIINSKLLLYLKNLFNSKYFVLREIFSSMIGEIIYVAIAFTIAFYSIFPVREIVSMACMSILIKGVSTVVLSLPSKLTVMLLKKQKLESDHTFSSLRIKV